MLSSRVARLLKSIAVPLVVALLSWIDLTGCTALGFAIGAHADQAGSYGPPARLVEAHVGSTVTLWLTDGRSLKGRLLGFVGADSAATPVVADRRVRRLPAGARIVIEPYFDDAISAWHPRPRGQVSRVTVPVDSVNQVSVSMARGKVVGALMGLAVDAIVVSVAVQSLNDAMDCRGLEGIQYPGYASRTEGSAASR